MFKATKSFNILLFPMLFMILFSLSGTAVQIIAAEDVLTPSYNWIPQFYGKIKGKSKLLYTRSFARSQLRFVDIDNDGDDDLFVGKADGRIAFFVNEGSFSVPLFKLETEDFVVIHEGLDEQNNPSLLKTVLDVGSNSAPEFADIQTQLADMRPTPSPPIIEGVTQRLPPGPFLQTSAATASSRCATVARLGGP